ASLPRAAGAPSAYSRLHVCLGPDGALQHRRHLEVAEGLPIAVQAGPRRRLAPVVVAPLRNQVDRQEQSGLAELGLERAIADPSLVRRHPRQFERLAELRDVALPTAVAGRDAGELFQVVLADAVDGAAAFVLLGVARGV